MEREIERLLPYILGGMFVLGVLLFLLALQQLRRRRTGQHWRSRRRAGDRGGRLFLISVFLMVGSVVLTFVSGLATLAYRNINPLPTRGSDNLYGIVLSPDVLLTATAQAIAQIPSPTDAITEAVAVTSTPTTTESPVPSATSARIPPATSTRTPTLASTVTVTTAPPTSTRTPTPQATLNLTATLNTTPPPASADAKLSVDAVSDQYSVSAPSPLQQFSAGIERVYVYISFDHIANGAAWSRVLYRNGAALQRDSLLWSLGDSGSSYFFFGDQAGYRSGDYEVRLFVGNQETSNYHFTLMDERES